MTGKLSITFTVRGYELDSYDHVNNAVYLNYFEHARWDFFHQLDLYHSLKTTGNLPVVTDMHIRYQREMKLFDEIRVESSCQVQRPYLVFNQRIINLTTGLPAARAVTKLIFIDNNRVPIDIPDQVIRAI